MFRLRSVSELTQIIKIPPILGLVFFFCTVNAGASEFDGLWKGEIAGNNPRICRFESIPITALVNGKSVQFTLKYSDHELKFSGSLNNQNQVNFWGPNRSGFANSDEAPKIEGEIKNQLFDGTIVVSKRRFCFATFSMKTEQEEKLDPDRKNEIETTTAPSELKRPNSIGSQIHKFDGIWEGRFKSTDLTLSLDIELESVQIKESNIRISFVRKSSLFTDEIWNFTGTIENNGHLRINKNMSYYNFNRGRVRGPYYVTLDGNFLKDKFEANVFGGKSEGSFSGEVSLIRKVDPIKLAEEKKKKNAKEAQRLAQIEKEKREVAAGREKLEEERQKFAEEKIRKQNEISRIKSIQEALQTLEIYKGPIDGDIGRKTLDGIRAWHKRKGNSGSDDLNSRQLSALKQDAKDETTRQAKLAAGKNLAEERLKQQKIAEEKRQIKLENEKAFAGYKSNKNTKYLFAGSGEDILFLFNESGHAKNGIRDLSGKIVFEEDKVEFCSFSNSKVKKSLLEYVRFSLSKMGVNGRKLGAVPQNCKDLEISEADLIVVNRQTFLDQQFEKSKDFLKLVVSNRLVRHSEFSINLHKDILKKQKESSIALLSTAQLGNREGFGLIKANSKISSICHDNTDDSGLIKSVLSTFRANDPISLRKIDIGSIVSSSTNQNFIKLKRNRCGFYVGNAKSLKLISTALVRDRYKFEMHHEWLSFAQIAKVQSKDSEKSNPSKVGSKIPENKKNTEIVQKKEIGQRTNPSKNRNKIDKSTSQSVRRTSVQSKLERLALDVLNYTETGNKTAGWWSVVDLEKCIFKRRFGRSSADYRLKGGKKGDSLILFLNEVNPQAVQISQKFESINPIYQPRSIVVVTLPGDGRGSVAKSGNKDNKSVAFYGDASVDFDRVRKAWSTIYPKVCKGKESEF